MSHPFYGGLHSMLLSTQQILVCFLLLPNLLCQKAVEDLERCMPWPGLCGSSNVSTFSYMGGRYMAMCIYTVNEVIYLADCTACCFRRSKF